MLFFFFFGLSPEILKIESELSIDAHFSLSILIFLSFIFFNTLLASLALFVFENFRRKTNPNDKTLTRNIKGKKYLVYLSVGIICVYLVFNLHFYHNRQMRRDHHFKRTEHIHKSQLNSNEMFISQAVLFFLPFFMFFLNALINLTYYYDIVYLENVINMIVDKEYFLTNEEANVLFSNNV